MILSISLTFDRAWSMPGSLGQGNSEPLGDVLQYKSLLNSMMCLDDIPWAVIV